MSSRPVVKQRRAHRLRSGRSSSRWPRLSPPFLLRSGLPALPGRRLGASAVSLARCGFCSGWGGGGGIVAPLSDTLLLARRDAGDGRGKGRLLWTGAPHSPCDGAAFAACPGARSGRPSALQHDTVHSVGSVNLLVHTMGSVHPECFSGASMRCAASFAKERPQSEQKIVSACAAPSGSEHPRVSHD